MHIDHQYIMFKIFPPPKLVLELLISESVFSIGMHHRPSLQIKPACIIVFIPLLWHTCDC